MTHRMEGTQITGDVVAGWVGKVAFLWRAEEEL